MDQLIQFVITNWMLVAALVVVLVLIAHTEMSGTIKGVQFVQPKQAINLINREDAKVIDVRAHNAFQDGHITGAMHISPSDIDKQSSKLKKYQNHPLIVVCGDGMQQSSKVAAQLKQAGFNVFGIRGGIRAWQQDSLPLVK